MWRLDPRWLAGDGEAAVARAWRAAEPFPHVIVDGAIEPDALDELLAIVDDEPVEHYAGDIFAFDATAPEPTTAALRDVRDELAAVYAPILSRATGKSLGRADLRAYAYRPGHYLLPHTDHRAGLPRQIAFAYYLPSPAPPTGGELELYRCELDGATGAMTSTVSARVIEPRANRLVLFDVADGTLHQVREVLAGLRISLAGWFYP